MQRKLVFVYRGFPADTDNKFEDFPCQKGCGVFMIYREIINVAGIPFYLELVFLFHVVQLCVYFYHSSTPAQMSESNEVIVQYIFRIAVAVVEWKLSLPLIPEKGLSIFSLLNRQFECVPGHGRSQGGPRVPVTPPLQSFLNQATYNR